MKRMVLLAMLAGGALAPAGARAGDVSGCWTLDNDERLRCYDVETGRPVPSPRTASVAARPAATGF